MTFEDYCRHNNIIIQHIGMTTKIKGMCIKQGEYYIVIINPKFCGSSQVKTLEHEIVHILEEHFKCSTEEIEECEKEVSIFIHDIKEMFINDLSLGG